MVMSRKTLASVQGGFTLIELMMVTIILAILLAIAAPSFVDLVRVMRVRSAAVDLYSDITLARNEAIKRGVQVSVLPRDTATARNWALGWDVVLTASTTTIIKSQEPLAGDVTAQGPGGTNGPTGIVFGQAGRPTAAASIEIKHANLASAKWRCVVLDLAGRPVSKTGGCS